MPNKSEAMRRRINVPKKHNKAEMVHSDMSMPHKSDTKSHTCFSRIVQRTHPKQVLPVGHIQMNMMWHKDCKRQKTKLMFTKCYPAGLSDKWVV